MGCICSKGTRAHEYVENCHLKDKESGKTSKKVCASSRKDAELAGADCSGNEATTRLIPKNSETVGSTPVSSDEGEKKEAEVVKRRTSTSQFQRRATTDVGASVGPVQPRMTRITSIPNGERGAQIIAGWPSWLAAVAGEAINGWIPRKADSFEKLEKIGQGTYSSVYRARDLEANKIVALKKVRFANMDPESVRFMAREIIILRRLDHPNIMNLEGLITSRVSGSLYLIFEYMEHDLAGLASTPGIKFTEGQIKCYMKQLLHGLEHCHSQGILHRDIKGSNLLIDHHNILKIGDFGLATIFRPPPNQPLTSRVVTLWYRPPELLLGSTDYGVSVDMWSSGCILAEMFTGKPIMPGRTEVEQLHKIFKLCGSPSEEYWRNSRLPHATIFKPQQPYKCCVAETFKDLPPSALALLEVLLAVEPDKRGTASAALQSEFFTTTPLPSDPSSLPKYSPRKEFDARLRDEEARRRRAGNGRDGSKHGYRESRAVPAPDANAELQASIQKRQGQSTNPISTSEKFNQEEDSGSGFPIEPAREAAQNGLSQSLLGGGNMDDLPGSSQAYGSSTKEFRTQRSFVQRGVNHLSRFSNSVAGRGGSHLESARDATARKRFNGKYGHLDDDGQSSEQHGWSHRLLENPKSSCKRDQAAGKGLGLGFAPKSSQIHYSGPLLPAGGNIDEMLKEHERQIRLAVRRAHVDKSKPGVSRDENGPGESLLRNGR